MYRLKKGSLSKNSQRQKFYEGGSLFDLQVVFCIFPAKCAKQGTNRSSWCQIQGTIRHYYDTLFTIFIIKKYDKKDEEKKTKI